MPSRVISDSALVAAPADTLYRIIADYHAGHPRIIPRPPFVGLEVVEGGIGDGTVIRVRIRVLGTVQTYHATITEPEPGRTLVETNDTGSVTTFTVEPQGDGRQSLVTITTDLGDRPGLRGAVERWLAARMIRPMLAEELALLAKAAGA